MSTEFEITDTLDVTGLNCPMPVVKTKQAVDDLAQNAILEVLASDPGSIPDIDGWAQSTAGVELLDQVEGDEIYKHYVRKAE